MNILRKILMASCLLAAMFVTPPSAFADAVGTWRIYPSYNTIEEIEPAGNYIFTKASSNLYVYNTNDNSTQAYDKTNVLSDINIKTLSWNSTTKRMVIVYDNENIDLMSVTGDVLNVPDLNKKQMTGDKTVNTITQEGQYAYMATGFGVVKLDVKNGYITDSYILNTNISHVAIIGSSIYALKANGGILKAAMSDNLNDPASWKQLSGSKYEYLYSLNGHLIGMTNGVVDEVNQTTGEVTNFGRFTFLWARKDSDRILCGGAYFFTEIKSDLSCRTYEAAYDLNIAAYNKADGFYWSNNKDNALTKYSVDENQKLVAQSAGVMPDGPANNIFWRLKVKDGVLYATSGGWCYELYNNKPGIIYTLTNDNEWSQFETPSEEKTGSRYMDVNTLDFDPANPKHTYVAARSGLYEFMDGKFVKSFNNTNSPLTTVGDPSWSIVTEVKFDKEGNLWVFNGYSDIPIKCLTKSGEWKTFPHSEMTAANKYGRDIERAVYSSVDGRMWFTNTSHSNSAVYAYDYKNDVLTSYKEIYNEDGNRLTVDGNKFYGCAEDKNGNIWVMTAYGPIYITPEGIKSGENVFIQHKVPRNDGTNYADYLLNGIRTNCIFVDSANRKWIGTESAGVFVISDDCNTQLENFTAENSVLPSNNVYDIAIDGSNGRVYIATDKGLCSYMSDATDSNEDMTDGSVYAFPNPVTPDFTGNITIAGLEVGAQIIITTASGAKVAEGTSTGGSFFWNGCDMSGRPVASGVYLVCVAKSNGGSAIVTKVAIVR